VRHAGLGLLTLLVVATGCAPDDALAPLPPSPITTTTSTTAPTTTVTSIDDEPWTTVRRSSRPEVVLIDPGGDIRAPLRYVAAMVSDVALVVRDTPNATPTGSSTETAREVQIGGTARPVVDGIRLEFDIARISVTDAAGDTSSRSAPAASMAMEVSSVGAVAVLASPQGTDLQVALDVADTLAPVLVPFPEETVGIGAIWTVATNGDGDSSTVAYELLASEGPLVTLRAIGDPGPDDGDHESGDTLDFPRSGIITIDTSSGRALGELRYPERAIRIDGPAVYSLRDPRPHRMRVEHRATFAGADNGSYLVELTGDVHVNDDGTLTFSGTTDLTARTEQGEEVWPRFDIRLATDGMPLTPRPETSAVLSRLPVSGLPVLATDSFVFSDSPTESVTSLPIDDLGISQWRGLLEWTVTRRAGSRFTVEASSSIDDEFFTRGAYNRIVAEISARWTIDVFDAFAVEGFVRFDGEYWLGEREPDRVVEIWEIASGSGNPPTTVDSTDG
jgi:hypothetical protein